MNLQRRQQQRRIVPSRKQVAFFLASAAIISTTAQGKPGNASRRPGQVPNIGKTLRSATTAMQGGFSSIAQEKKTASENTASQNKEALLSNMKRQQEGSIPPSGTISSEPISQLGAWPCMDELDKSLIKISLPVIANFAIAPLVGTIDLFFINRMGNALAVAGQSAANQVFGSVFWLTSFLPSRKFPL